MQDDGIVHGRSVFLSRSLDRRSPHSDIGDGKRLRNKQYTTSLKTYEIEQRISAIRGARLFYLGKGTVQ